MNNILLTAACVHTGMHIPPAAFCFIGRREVAVLKASPGTGDVASQVSEHGLVCGVFLQGRHGNTLYLGYSIDRLMLMALLARYQSTVYSVFYMGDTVTLSIWGARSIN